MAFECGQLPIVRAHQRFDHPIGVDISQEQGAGHPVRAQLVRPHRRTVPELQLDDLPFLSANK